MSLKNNILIVGGTGFIGYHLAKKSLKKGWKVTSISSKRPRKKRYLPQVKYIICDITKKKSLRKNIIRKTDQAVLFNCASGLKSPMPVQTLELDVSENIDYSKL